MRTKPLILMLCLLVSVSILKADNLLGGEITWSCIGKDSFIVRLNVIIDQGKTDIGDAIIKFKCKNTGVVISEISIPKPSPYTWFYPLDDSNVCCLYGIEGYVYQKLFVFSDSLSCCDILISYSKCCRSDYLQNIPSNTNFYIESVLNRCLSPCDNSTKFSNPSLHISYINYPSMICCLSGTDDDLVHGEIDEYQYEIFDPLTEHDQQVQFLPPYSATMPLDIFDSLNKDKPYPRGFRIIDYGSTIGFTPIKAGYYLFSYKYNEFRKDIRIGEMIRDFVIIVVENKISKPPEISGDFYKEVFAGDTVQMHFDTYDPEDTVSIHVYRGYHYFGSWQSNNYTVKHASGTFTWVPNDTNVSVTPYDFFVSAIDFAKPIPSSSFKEFSILVKKDITGSNSLQNLKNAKIYPNPANDQLTIESSENMDKVILYNFLGAKIREMDVTENRVTLNRDKLPSGLYLLKVFDIKGEVYVYQVVFK